MQLVLLQFCMPLNHYQNNMKLYLKIILGGKIDDGLVPDNAKQRAHSSPEDQAWSRVT